MPSSDLYRACCCETNPYCEGCQIPNFQVTGLSGTVELDVECPGAGAPNCDEWEGTASWTLPSTLDLAADPAEECVYVGCSAYSSVTVSLTFCVPSDYPEGYPDPPDCEYEMRARLCGELVGGGGLSPWTLYLWVEMQQRLSGGTWYDCKTYAASGPSSLLNWYPWARYVDPSDPIGDCPAQRVDWSQDDTTDGSMADESACAAGDDCEVTGDAGTYQVEAPCWRFVGDVGWPANVQLVRA